jgi:glycosyltransferase involved in cell wall biosynthesis
MLVSILIPCFNAERWIGQTIESALAQTWPEKEIIVVDDGSTDRSLDVIRGFGQRISWESGPNKGAPAARNRLLELSRGDWLQYLDADDYLRPEKISLQADFARQHPEADIVYSPTLCEKISNGRTVLVDEPMPDPLDDPWVLLALWYLPQTGGPLWKRAALERVNGWRFGQPCCQEHELYFRLLAAGSRFMFFPDRSAVYRNWNFGGRITTRLIQEVPKERLIILDRIEVLLDETDALTDERRQAINDARHQIARGFWLRDHDAALRIIERIHQSDERFYPSEGPASPTGYQVIYRRLGFRRTQRIADFLRWWRQTSVG